MRNSVTTRNALADAVRTFSVVLCAALGLTACVSEPSKAAALTPEQIATAKHACIHSMDFSPGYADYQACVLSLQHTLVAINEARLTEHARERCAGSGLAVGTPEFAKCVIASDKISDAN